MAGLAIVKVMKVAVLAVLLAAPAASQSHEEVVTEREMKTIHLPSNSHALTIIKFSKDRNASDTRAYIQISSINNYMPLHEEFTIGQDDGEKRNIIAIIYEEHPLLGKIITVWNMLKGKIAIAWDAKDVGVWSEQRVTWQVWSHNDSASLIALTTDPSASTLNTSLPCTPTEPYLTQPIFITLASLCGLIALSTLALAVVQCLRCATAKNTLGQAATSSDPTTFKSTETLVKQQDYFPYKYQGRGSLHISENSLYGVL